MLTLDEYQSKLRSNFDFIRFDVERFMHLLDNDLAPPDAYIGGGECATAWELPTRPGLVLRIPLSEDWRSHVEERVDNWTFGGRGRVTAVDPFAIRHEIGWEAGASTFVHHLYDWALSLSGSRFEDVDSVRRSCGRFVGAARQLSIALAGDPERSLIADWLEFDFSRHRISHSRSARATVAEAIESAIQDYPAQRLANTYLSVPTR